MEQLALGVPEDLLTQLAGSSIVPVLSRNTSFQFKGQEVCDAARSMTARFVLGGSLRKVGDRLRITAQLIECPQDTHIWAETYDREVGNTFALQEEVAGTIAVSSQRVLLPRVLSEYPSGFLTALGERTREENARALAVAREGVEKAPDAFSRTVWLSWVVNIDLRNLIEGWSDSPLEVVEEMSEAARLCVEEYPHALCWWAAGWASLAAGEQDQMVAAFERAVAVAGVPSSYTHLGFALALAGRSDEAIASLEEAMRLSRQDDSYLLSSNAFSHFAAGHYEEAADWAQRVVPRYEQSGFYKAFAYSLLAASNAHLGRLEEAQAALKEAKQLRPELSRTLNDGWPWVSAWDRELLDRYVEGLRIAGLED